MHMQIQSRAAGRACPAPSSATESEGTFKCGGRGLLFSVSSHLLRKVRPSLQIQPRIMQYEWHCSIATHIHGHTGCSKHTPAFPNKEHACATHTGTRAQAMRDSRKIAARCVSNIDIYIESNHVPDSPTERNLR